MDELNALIEFKEMGMMLLKLTYLALPEETKREAFLKAETELANALKKIGDVDFSKVSADQQATAYAMLMDMTGQTEAVLKYIGGE